MRISDWSSDVCSSDLTVVIILFDLSPIVDARQFRMGDASVFRNFAKEILAIDGLKAAAKEPRKIEAETREFLFLNVRHFHDDVGRRWPTENLDALRDPCESAGARPNDCRRVQLQ